MDRACDVCGTTYVAKRATSRYCSATCRTRKSRGASVTAISPPTTSPASSYGVEQATTQALSEAGRLDTPLGQACLVLAKRLDAPGIDNGSAIAGLVKQLEASLASATRGAGGSTSPQQLQDELAERRRRHGA